LEHHTEQVLDLLGDRRFCYVFITILIVAGCYRIFTAPNNEFTISLIGDHSSSEGLAAFFRSSSDSSNSYSNNSNTSKHVDCSK
jgi:hypothetical protein